MFPGRVDNRHQPPCVFTFRSDKTETDRRLVILGGIRFSAGVNVQPRARTLFPTILQRRTALRCLRTSRFAGRMPVERKCRVIPDLPWITSLRIDPVLTVTLSSDGVSPGSPPTIAGCQGAGCPAGNHDPAGRFNPAAPAHAEPCTWSPAVTPGHGGVREVVLSPEEMALTGNPRRWASREFVAAPCIRWELPVLAASTHRRSLPDSRLVNRRPPRIRSG